MELSKRLQHIWAPLCALSLMFYFAYHVFQGERGLFSWIRLRQKIAESEQELSTLQAEKEALERNVSLLRPDSLDRDMLEERAREVLNFARPDEVVIYDSERVTNNEKSK